MISSIKEFLKTTILMRWIANYRRYKTGYDDVRSRVAANISEYYPYHDVIDRYRISCDLRVFVESGTFIGNTLLIFGEKFEKLYSIELSRELHDLVKSRFKSNENIILRCGDSSTELSYIVSLLDQPALFWLDAHYSSGVTALGKVMTPIESELYNIHSMDKGLLRRSAILIDDLKDFNGKNGYPTQINLMSICEKYFDDTHSIFEDSGVLCIIPKGNAF